MCHDQAHEGIVEGRSRDVGSVHIIPGDQKALLALRCRTMLHFLNSRL